MVSQFYGRWEHQRRESLISLTVELAEASGERHLMPRPHHSARSSISSEKHWKGQRPLLEPWDLRLPKRTVLRLHRPYLETDRFQRRLPSQAPDRLRLLTTDAVWLKAAAPTLRQANENSA